MSKYLVWDADYECKVLADRDEEGNLFIMEGEDTEIMYDEKYLIKELTND